MHILRLNLGDIEVQHLEELVAARVRESEALEFKATLPFQPQKGQSQQADRWIEQGDRIGEYARDQILSEIAAFANANGGTLIIGVEETRDYPREAIALSPLPKCEPLAQRLLDAAEDIVEPRLMSLVARGLPIDETGQGYVVLRVGRSRVGPHRVNGKAREFYVRRGERAARMEVREIKALTLDLARSDERLEATFESRRRVAHDKFQAMPGPEFSNHAPPLLARVSALPTLAEQIEGLTERPELWWQGGAFQLEFKQGQPFQCGFPARDFNGSPRIQLRSLVSEDIRLTRILRSDGLVEAVLAIEALRLQSSPAEARVYVEWLLSLLVGILAQVEHVRRGLGWDAVEYGLEVELWSNGPIHLLLHDKGWGDHNLGRPLTSAHPLRFPIYSVRQLGTFNELVNQFLQDLYNAWGIKWNDTGSVDWDKLLNR